MFQLYIKSWCPWCVAAKKWLDEHGYDYEEFDIERDAAAASEMVRLSGQRLSPTLVVGDLVLPDFGPEELESFVREHDL